MKMLVQWINLAVPAVVLGLAVLPAKADIWKATPAGARFGAHYLVHSETGAVVSMRENRCLRSFGGAPVKDTSGATRVNVESEIGEGGGPRGRQKMSFLLREGSGSLTVESTLRGAQPPLAVEYAVICRGKACILPPCG